MQKLKKNDEVIVIAGKSKGHQGKILDVIKDKATRQVEKVVVEGANKVKKHVKPDPNQQRKGGISEQERPIHVSNVALYNPTTQKKDKLGIKTLEDGRKVRYFKSNGEIVDI